MREVLLILLAVLVLFLIGFFWPRRSRRAQEKIKDVSAKSEEKAEGRWGKLGEWTATSVEVTRSALESATHAGRKSHDVAFDSREGEREDEKLREEYGPGGEQGEGPTDPYPR